MRTSLSIRDVFFLVGLLMFLSSAIVWSLVESFIQTPVSIHTPIVFSGIWAGIGFGIMVISTRGEKKSEPAE